MSRNGLNSGIGWSRHFAARELDRETEVQTKILAPLWGFFSAGHFAAHERKFGRHLKEIFSELYREFEYPLVRQQVIDISERIGMSSICATFPAVSVRIRENSKLRARITPYSSD
jgi:hypothetical protein